MDTTTIAPVKEYHQMTINEYLEAQQEIANRLMNMSDDYIAIGFLLRQIDESEAYRQDGYESLKDFAKDKYNMSESSVSRFININKEFSKHGYSKEISEDYRGYGVSKLTELLNMCVEDRQLVTAATTVAQIREIKEFNREAEALAEEQIPGQQNVEDTIAAYERGEFTGGLDTSAQESETVIAEVLAPQERVNTRTWNDLETILIEFFREQPELLNDIYRLSLSTVEDVVERINPAGNLTYRHKTLFIFMYGASEGVILKKMGVPNTSYTWSDVIQTITDIYKDTYTDHDTVHQNFYSQEKAIEEPKPAEPQKAAVEEYETPHPESITSICYSCTEYETCNVKKSTCVNCDQYKNRAEAQKTDEQRYDEEQAKIDKETAKKLQEMADEKKMEKLPSASERTTHEINMGTDMFNDAIKNKRTFELRPTSEEYYVGELVGLIEYGAGTKTGRTVTKIITDIMEDVVGLEDDWCILSLAPVDEDGQPSVYVDVSKVCDCIYKNANGSTQDGEDYILVDDAMGFVKLGIHR